MRQPKVQVEPSKGGDNITRSQIDTVTGPIGVDELGRTLMHEHVFVTYPELLMQYEADFDEPMLIKEAQVRLDAMVSDGVPTIVDLTVLGLGRYIPRIKSVAAGTEAHIIVATGMYIWDSLPLPWQTRPPTDSSDPLTELFVSEITHGIGNTGVRAGILKCATDVAGVTPDNQRVLRAVARAHRQTGVPITTHTAHGAGCYGDSQQAIFLEEGVNLENVIIGHACGSSDIPYLRSLMDRGSTLGMDQFGCAAQGIADEVRIQAVAELCRLGYAAQMVLSHDAVIYQDMTEPYDMSSNHYSYIPTQIVPELLRRGVSQTDIDLMLIDTPARMLAGTEPY